MIITTVRLTAALTAMTTHHSDRHQSDTTMRPALASRTRTRERPDKEEVSGSSPLRPTHLASTFALAASAAIGFTVSLSGCFVRGRGQWFKSTYAHLT